MAIALVPFKETSTGLPGWFAMSAGGELGRLYDLGVGSGMRWKGYAADGTPFSARSQAELIQKLQIHAAAPPAAATQPVTE